MPPAGRFLIGSVVFANTGKERPETLDFVQECAERWDVPIPWLEYDPEAPHRTRLVDYTTPAEPESLTRWSSRRRAFCLTP